MKYKDDWEMAKRRIKAWFEGELIDRPVIQVTAPRKEVNINHNWTSLSLIKNYDASAKMFREYEKYCEGTYFGGEAFPNLWINMGSPITAAYLGCPPQIEEDTVWFEPLQNKTYEQILATDLNEENKWWQITRNLTSEAVKWGKGKFIVGFTDINSVLNTLGSLRSTETLLKDLVDQPENVKNACNHVLKIWRQCYNELAEILTCYQEGTSAWMGVWYPGKGYDIECDFSAMISPDMFKEFVLPILEQECYMLDHSIYHMDGPGQIPHLDHLLAIKNLDGIQWVPGAGQPGVGSSKWFSLYKKIQQKNKLLVLQGAAPENVKRLIAELSPQGLFITTSCSSEKEAGDLLKMAEDCI